MKRPDAVRVQFSVSIRKKKGVKIPKEILELALRRWIVKQPLPKGVRVNAVIWKNPDRIKPADRGWRGTGSAKAIRGLLRGETFAHVDADAESARDSLASLTLAASISFKVGRN